MDPAHASMVVHPEFTVGAIDPRIHGMLLGHLGRAVYGGIFEPGHASADDEGFHGEVLALVRELGVPVVR